MIKCNKKIERKDSHVGSFLYVYIKQVCNSYQFLLYKISRKTIKEIILNISIQRITDIKGYNRKV